MSNTSNCQERKYHGGPGHSHSSPYTDPVRVGTTLGQKQNILGQDTSNLRELMSQQTNTLTQTISLNGNKM